MSEKKAEKSVQGGYDASSITVLEGLEAVRKRPGLTGPVDDAFMDSFVFVRPTGKPLNPTVGSWVTNELTAARRLWHDVFRGDAPVIDDTALTAAGFTVVAPEPYASPIIVTVQLPPAIHSADVGAHLERRGFLASHQSAYLTARHWIQFCLIGAPSRATLAALVATGKPVVLVLVNGQRVRKPEAGAAGSLSEAKLIYHRNGSRGAASRTACSSASAAALDTWRSMRRDSVSMPCRIRKALNGDSAAPMLRSGTTRARPM